jgi:hypothetical protein
LQHAEDSWSIAIITVVFSLVILARILFARSGKLPTIRRIAGLNAIDEAVGRATEMGRPILMVPGVGGIGSDPLDTIPTLNAMSIFSYITRIIAKFGTHSIMATADPVVTGVAEDVLRDAYNEAGKPELFSTEDVRFLSDRQFAFASGVAGLVEREKPAANFLIGAFYAESLILAEMGQRVGAIQIAATNQTVQLPFFIATCDYVLIGDEFYAASAYISKNPELLGSIVGQDYCKVFIVAAIILGTVAASLIGSHVGHGEVASLLNGFLNIFKE